MWSINVDTIESVARRRFQLQDKAIEVFFSTGRSHLLTFPITSNRETVISWLTTARPSLALTTQSLAAITKLWQQGGLTNFQYLTTINSLAGRTTNDLMQYPIFPWILADYTSDHLDLTAVNSYRDLRKPVAVQHEESTKKYQETYQMLQQE